MESILTNRVGQKQKVVAEKPEMEDEEMKRGGSGGDKKGSGNGGGSGSSMKCCQAEKCTVDLSDAKQYHKRHKVCEHHAKAPVVVVAGILQRFCQQCSRFHELSEFDEAKRSCRRRLAGHNERRRKNSGDAQVEGPGQRGSGGGVNNHSMWAS